MNRLFEKLSFDPNAGAMVGKMSAPVADIVPGGFNLRIAGRRLREVASLRETHPQTQGIFPTHARTSVVLMTMPLQAPPAALHGSLGPAVQPSKTPAAPRRNK
jgi:hypothetical protein